MEESKYEYKVDAYGNHNSVADIGRDVEKMLKEGWYLSINVVFPTGACILGWARQVKEPS